MSDDEVDINKVLANALVIGIEKLTKAKLDKIKEFWLKKTHAKYGFSPTSGEANKLKEIAKNPTYLAFKVSIGSSPYTPFIKVGLMIYDLKCEGNLERIKEINEEIRNSRYTDIARKIIHIASTGVLLNTLQYIVDIKTQSNLSTYAVEREFNRLLILWTKVSIGVKSSDKVIEVRIKLINLMNKNPELMIVYATQSAVNIAQTTIAEMKNLGQFKGKYLPWSKNLSHYDLEQYLCIFYKVDTDFLTAFG